MSGIRTPKTYPKKPWSSSVLIELSGDSPPMSLGKVNFTALLSETEGTVLGPKCFSFQVYCLEVIFKSLRH